MNKPVIGGWYVTKQGLLFKIFFLTYSLGELTSMCIEFLDGTKLSIGLDEFQYMQPLLQGGKRGSI